MTFWALTQVHTCHRWRAGNTGWKLAQRLCFFYSWKMGTKFPLLFLRSREKGFFSIKLLSKFSKWKHSIRIYPGPSFVPDPGWRTKIEMNEKFKLTVYNSKNSFFSPPFLQLFWLFNMVNRFASLARIKDCKLNLAGLPGLCLRSWELKKPPSATRYLS